MKQPERLSNERYMPHGSLIPFHQFLYDDVHLHWHEFYELHFVCSGEAIHSLNGKAHRLARGSVFLLTPADFHELKIIAPLESYNIIFSANAIRQEVYAQVFQYQRNYGLDLSEDAIEYLQSECKRLWEEHEHKSPGYQTIMHGALERILIEIARRGGHTDHGDTNHLTYHHKAIQNAILYMQHHFRESMTLSDVAKQVQLSANYFSELFRSITGFNFHHYLQDLRLVFGEVLLSTSDIPVTEIAYAAGFGSLSQFERAFKMKYEKSPKLYRTWIRHHKVEVSDCSLFHT